LLLDVRSVEDDVTDLNGGAGRNGDVNIKLVVVSTVDDLTVAAVDFGYGIAGVVYKDLVKTEIEAVLDLVIVVDFSDVYFDIPIVLKSCLLSDSILDVGDLELIGIKRVGFSGAVVVNGIVCTNKYARSTLKNNVA